MPSVFSFGGAQRVSPGFLLRTNISESTILELLPFGTPCFVGSSDGGLGGGTVYIFPNIGIMKKVLRGGPLLNAALASLAIGPAQNIVCCVAGPKSPGSFALTGSPSPGTFTAGDSGVWTNGIKVSIVASTGGKFYLLVQYPDAYGQVQSVGGPGSSLDGLATYGDLNAAILANQILSPPLTTGLTPLLTFALNSASAATALVALAQTPFAGGTGSGATQPTFAQYKAAIDALYDVPFDIGHIVNAYNEGTVTEPGGIGGISIALYADAQAQQLAPFLGLRRWIHQFGTSAATSQTKAQNSTALLTAGSAAAPYLTYRSSLCVQKIQNFDPTTGKTALIDGAILAVGQACYWGANGPNGPATPCTWKHLPFSFDVDFPILDNGDKDAGILAGVWFFERTGPVAQGAVRTVESVTAQINDPSTGLPWINGEFSMVRTADAVAANMKAAIETRVQAIGSGNDIVTEGAVIAEARDVLGLALKARWLLNFDKSSIVITPTGSLGEDDILAYSMAIVPPLNHIGLDQSVVPFQVPVALGGGVGP